MEGIRDARGRVYIYFHPSGVWPPLREETGWCVASLKGGSTPGNPPFENPPIEFRASLGGSRPPDPPGAGDGHNNGGAAFGGAPTGALRAPGVVVSIPGPRGVWGREPPREARNSFAGFSIAGFRGLD